MTTALSDIRVSLCDVLASGASFGHFDLGLTATERDALKKLKADHSESYNNYGRMDALEAEVAAHLESRFCNPADVSAQAAAAVSKIAKEAMQATAADAAWVLISSKARTGAYDFPRWHTDIYRGAQDIPDPEKLRKAFDARVEELRNQQMNLDQLPARREIDAIIKDAPLSRARPGQASVFTPEGPNAAVHSEPPIHADRLFASIVTGTREQIDGLKKRLEQWSTPPQPPRPRS